MAPTATALFSSSADLAASAAITGTPSLTSSVYDAVSQHSQNTSPKQFIPVGVLTVFLILLFFSHLMRYPRFLYVSQKLLSNHSHSTQDNPNPNQLGHRAFREKVRDSRAGSFPNPSFSSPKRLSSFEPHTEAIYNEPTVRLVRAYHNRSPEPRVYLPEEITLPSPSQTLVDSPRTDTSVLNMDHQALPPRVYLPPVSPETFELGLSHQQADVFYTNHDLFASSNLQWVPLSNRQPPGLFTPPLARSSLGCYARVTTSSDMFTLPFIHDQLQASAVSDDSAEEDLELEPSYPMFSPEPSPPPPTHAHPILVRRALSPWRRRSCPLESSHDTFLQMDTDIVSVPSHRHRPSVPSRLRHFITRSVTTSWSGSLTHSTPASSSAGKRSQSSQTRSRPSSHPEGTVVSKPRRVEDNAAARFSEDLLNASAKMSALAATPGIQCQSSNFGYLSPAPVSYGQQNTPHDYCKQLSNSGDTGRYSHVPSSMISEENIAETEDVYEEGPNPHPSANMHRLTSDTCNSVGLGLGLDSGSRAAESPAHAAAASHTRDENCDEFGYGARYFQGYSGSLRTVPSRWMTSSSPAFDDDDARTLTEEIGEPMNGIPGDVLLADESGSGSGIGSDSVEIMVMRRSEGLDGV